MYEFFLINHYLYGLKRHIMASAENKIMQKRLLSAYLSSVLSISLVLLLVGVASLLLVNAGNVADYFKEHMQVSVVFKPQTPDAEVLSYQKVLQSRDYIREVEFVSREQGIREMEELLGADFLTVFETNPIPVSLNLSMRAEYVTPTQLDSLMGVISANPIVDEVVWQKSLIETLNENLHRISLVLFVFIAFLLFISVVLINNTVRLNIFGKRFSIHTMRLVGATKAFIRRPFLVEAMFQGLVAALLSIIMLLAILIFVKSQFEQMFSIFLLRQLLMVMGIVVASGLLLCVGTSFAVVGRMVTLRKEELYL